MGPFLPNCRFEGFFSLVHASLKIHLFYKALYIRPLTGNFPYPYFTVVELSAGKNHILQKVTFGLLLL